MNTSLQQTARRGMQRQLRAMEEIRVALAQRNLTEGQRKLHFH